MSEILILENLLKTHRVATNTEEVWRSLQINFENTYVRSLMSQLLYPLSEIISKPLILLPLVAVQPKNSTEIQACDLLNNKDPVFFRVIDEPETPGIVEIKNKHHKEWFRPEMGGLRIYIPI